MKYERQRAGEKSKICVRHSESKRKGGGRETLDENEGTEGKGGEVDEVFCTREEEGRQEEHGDLLAELQRMIEIKM